MAKSYSDEEMSKTQNHKREPSCGRVNGYQGGFVQKWRDRNRGIAPTAPSDAVKRLISLS